VHILQKFSFGLASVALLAACGSSEPEMPAEPALDLSSVEAKVSYSLAYNYVGQLEEGGVTLASEAFLAGSEDGVSGAVSRVSDEEMQLAFQTFQAQLQAEAQAELEALGAESLIRAEAFLAENALAEGIQITDSGLQYRVVTEGDGAMPTIEDTVRVHYTGMLVDGTVFDSSVERGEPVEFGVTQVIPGWTEALQLMSEGSQWELFLHPDLGYGPSGAGGLIGPNEVLIFEVELLAASVE
jgi:FKBP-type peptidyl-prolyl cis-trans isomerase